VIDARYLGALAALATLAALAAWPWVDRWPGGREGLLAGIAFSLVSLGAGYHALRWGARSGGSKLFAAVVGSTLARVAALLAVALALAGGSDAHVAVALLTIVVLHLVLGTFEILYLKRTDALE
jgi:fatty acid desaturase